MSSNQTASGLVASSTRIRCLLCDVCEVAEAQHAMSRAKGHELQWLKELN